MSARPIALSSRCLARSTQSHGRNTGVGPARIAPANSPRANVSMPRANVFMTPSRHGTLQVYPHMEHPCAQHAVPCKSHARMAWSTRPASSFAIDRPCPSLHVKVARAASSGVDGTLPEVSIADLSPSPDPAEIPAIYIPRSLAKGEVQQHNQSVVVLGDVPEGSKVVSSGDVVVMGRWVLKACESFPLLLCVAEEGSMVINGLYIW